VTRKPSPLRVRHRELVAGGIVVPEAVRDALPIRCLEGCAGRRVSHDVDAIERVVEPLRMSVKHLPLLTQALPLLEILGEVVVGRSRSNEMGAPPPAETISCIELAARREAQATSARKRHFTRGMTLRHTLNADPTRVPSPASAGPHAAVSNTKCPSVPRPAPRSDALEMRYTG